MDKLELIPIREFEMIEDEMLALITAGKSADSIQGTCGANSCEVNTGSCTVNGCKGNDGICGTNMCKSNISQTEVPKEHPEYP